MQWTIFFRELRFLLKNGGFLLAQSDDDGRRHDFGQRLVAAPLAAHFARPAQSHLSFRSLRPGRDHFHVEVRQLLLTQRPALTADDLIGVTIFLDRLVGLEDCLAQLLDSVGQPGCGVPGGGKLLLALPGHVQFGHRVGDPRRFLWLGRREVDRDDVRKRVLGDLQLLEQAVDRGGHLALEFVGVSLLANVGLLRLMLGIVNLCGWGGRQRRKQVTCLTDRGRPMSRQPIREPRETRRSTTLRRDEWIELGVGQQSQFPDDPLRVGVRPHHVQLGLYGKGIGRPITDHLLQLDDLDLGWLDQQLRAGGVPPRKLKREQSGQPGDQAYRRQNDQPATLQDTQEILDGDAGFMNAVGGRGHDSRTRGERIPAVLRRLHHSAHELIRQKSQTLGSKPVRSVSGVFADLERRKPIARGAGQPAHSGSEDHGAAPSVR